MKILKTAAQWYKIAQSLEPDFRILDPDGWRDGESDFESDLITAREFDMRALQCTVQCNLSDPYDLEKWCEDNQ